MLHVVDILVLMGDAFLLDFVVLRGIVDTDVEDCITLEKRERKLLGEGFGEGLHRVLRLEARIFLRGGLEGRSGALAYV